MSSTSIIALGTQIVFTKAWNIKVSDYFYDGLILCFQLDLLFYNLISKFFPCKSEGSCPKIVPSRTYASIHFYFLWFH